MAEHDYKFNVNMTCSGCSGAIDRVLKKMDGLNSYDINLEQKLVDVKAPDSVDFDTVLNKIGKTQKKIKWGTKDGVEQTIPEEYLWKE